MAARNSVDVYSRLDLVMEGGLCIRPELRVVSRCLKLATTLETAWQVWAMAGAPKRRGPKALKGIDAHVTI